MERRLRTLSPEAVSSLEAVIVRDWPARTLAEQRGAGVAETNVRLVGLLRQLDDQGGSTAQDQRIGEYLFSNLPVAESDELARELWSEEADPADLHALEKVVQELQRLPKRAWAEASLERSGWMATELPPAIRAVRVAMCPRRISLAGGAPAATLAGMARCLAWGVLAAVLGLAVAGPAPASAQACEPLPCSEILVDLPYALDFAATTARSWIATASAPASPTSIRRPTAPATSPPTCCSTPRRGARGNDHGRHRLPRQRTPSDNAWRWGSTRPAR